MAAPENAEIHPTAVVEDGAVIGPGASVGPFCLVGPHVTLGPGVTLKSHVVITGKTRIGAETVVFPFCVLGEDPQDLKFSGERTSLEIGERNRIREHVTMNTGTEGGGGVTRIGDDCLFMAGVHIAHDCHIGNRVVFVNHSGVAGHCTVSDDVIVGGLSGVHQWVRVGRGAIIGAVTMVAQDVIPFGLVRGPRGSLAGLNLVGLRRKGMSRADIAALRAAFDTLAGSEGSFQDRVRQLSETEPTEHVREIIEFVTAESDRQFLIPRPEG